MVSVFFSYSHKDEDLRDRLETHLAMLRNEGLIGAWHDRRILAGDLLDHSISAHLDAAEVILLLVSPDFLASKYCYDVEMARAMERHEARDARVIPVILRACDWHNAPFGKLLAAPKDGKPIRAWPDVDEAFLDVARQVRAALPKRPHASLSPPPKPASTVGQAGPRSSNLRLKKEFTEVDQDRFLHETFEYMAAFFENSLSELQARNASIKTNFRRLDVNRFTAVIYQHGKAVARGKVALGGMFGHGISFSHNDQASDDSSNELLSVGATEQSLHMKALNLPMRGRKGEHLSSEGASEYFWSMLVEPLQR